jgi:Cobalamin-independent synthase, Catalytic domain
MSGLDAFKEFPLPANVDFWAGVIGGKSTITETAQQVVDRINALLRVIPAERLGVTTDCGLILLQRYIAQDKLHALVEGTKLVRERLRRGSSCVAIELAGSPDSARQLLCENESHARLYDCLSRLWARGGESCPQG